MFLKELYVIETARRAGVGKTIMQALAGIAVKNGCGRFEWQTDALGERWRAVEYATDIVLVAARLD